MDNKILNDQILSKDERIKFLENKLNLLRKEYIMIKNENKKMLKLKSKLKDENFNINTMPDKEKLGYLNILVNHYTEELNNINIEKRKLEEREKFKKEIGTIQIIDDKFIDNLLKNKK